MRSLKRLAVVLCMGAHPLLADGVDIEAILAENPDPFADVDMAAVLAGYGPEGSGIALKRGGVALVPGAVSLARKASALSGDPSAIDGAASLLSDPSGFGFTIGLSGDYLFAFDEFTLSEEAQTALAQVLDLYHEYEGTEIAIEGHTDSKGSDAYNQTLSENRARAVYEWFLARGMDGSLMTTAGFGETRPVAANEINGQDNPEGRALNRRVDIRITTRKKVNFVPLKP